MPLPTSPALTYSIGRVDHPPAYYEVRTPAAGSTKPPVVMIHGGAHTGACYLATPDGRKGWAHVFVAQGYQVVVPGWPGLGRSGYIPLAETSGEVIVAGLGARCLRPLPVPRSCSRTPCRAPMDGSC